MLSRLKLAVEARTRQLTTVFGSEAFIAAGALNAPNDPAVIDDGRWPALPSEDTRPDFVKKDDETWML